jgi:hypothetical protein
MAEEPIVLASWHPFSPIGTTERRRLAEPSMFNGMYQQPESVWDWPATTVTEVKI